MNRSSNIPLDGLISFRTHGGIARTFYQLESEDDVAEFATAVIPTVSEWFVLGGGSNILITRPVECVAQVLIRSRMIVEEDTTSVTLRLGAGEQWHSCVEWAVEQGWAGIEAMALIPGTVGAAPIQNIGAYGQQLSDVCRWVEGIDVVHGKFCVLPAAECQFGYRDSIFKRARKGTFIITAVGIQLEKRTDAYVHYEELQRALANCPHPTISDVYKMVIRLRQSKLPPYGLGNAGSFFKNPVISPDHAMALVQQYPSLPHYPSDGGVKLSAAWLIEQCGFKGIRQGSVGVYDKHALVLVNYGDAHAVEVIRLATEIKRTVRDRFGIELEEEVVIV